MEMIKVQYIYSACVIISTKDQKVLCDPWFSEGVYDGSWYHFPIVDDPVNLIGEVDSVYISHIHPDHYDPIFLKKYFETYGVKPVWIPDHNPNYLLKKMGVDGINAKVVGRDEELVIGDTKIQIMPADSGSVGDIDSALIVKYKGQDRIHCVVNANDIIFNDELIHNLKKLSNDVDILLCGYTGAGPYPQTYFTLDDPQLPLEASKKKKRFFGRYKKLTSKINARVNIPFAGKYMLGGKLASLNSFRGVADPVEVLDFDKNAVVLSDQIGCIDTEKFKPNSIRTEPYSQTDIANRIKEISGLKMKYERLIPEDEIHQLPLKRLVFSAYKNALNKSEVTVDYYFAILIDSNFLVINANKYSTSGVQIISNVIDLPSPRSEITIDPRYLFGLLTGVYHWNNAEVGSQYNVLRVPNEHNRKAQGFLNFFSIV